MTTLFSGIYSFGHKCTENEGAMGFRKGFICKYSSHRLKGASIFSSTLAF